ncbi:hypothetical protein F4778DRAFT_775510 [Xylariomycetidae sp. FL2044]|nr:hypothetical protein F4778DRAFT_775510 [Xylariomycetidae sp. FL2044]
MNRPLSATTSTISFTGNRDFGMKFLANPNDMASRPIQVTELPPEPIAVEGELVTAQTQQPPHPEAMAARPPPYRGRRNSYDTASTSTGITDQEKDAECHPFWVGWWDILKGMLYIIGGVFKLPFTLVHGLAKIFYYIPILYGDKTVEEWPEITGFVTGCVASIRFLCMGIWYGLTDWVVVPYKMAKLQGVKGFFKGFPMGFGSMVFKPASGVLGFVGHPFYGIYKECAKIKVIIKRERKPRSKKLDSPV